MLAYFWLSYPEVAKRKLISIQEFAFGSIFLFRITKNIVMDNHETELKKVICQAIKEHKVLWFNYESDSGKYWRKVEPYLLAIKDKGKGNIFFTGYAYPSKERKTKSTNNNQGQYLLNKIDIYKFEVLDETFDSLKISDEKIYGELPTIKIICRVVFD